MSTFTALSSWKILITSLYHLLIVRLLRWLSYRTLNQSYVGLFAKLNIHVFRRCSYRVSSKTALILRGMYSLLPPGQ